MVTSRSANRVHIDHDIQNKESAYTSLLVNTSEGETLDVNQKYPNEL